MPTTIKVENIGKRYQIGGLDAGYATFREFLASAMVMPIKRLRRVPKARKETIWALKDINFEVEQGEVVGLIGNNGAGKSTLLKILSHITVPTTGRSEVHGRLGSLLEVGTGFHPDLTGRDNIYMNGTILGIRRAEIRRKFDEIVAFSGIEKFIDTPVKWYSSGMYLRLAFSVAVHLTSDVLVMDEVLAVGDINFQQKCLDKMHEIRNQGRTILFVSHSMSAVTRLCERAILLDKGQMLADGPASDVVNTYLGSCKVSSERYWSPLGAPGNHVVKFRSARMRTTEGLNRDTFNIHNQVGIELTYEVLEPGHILTPKIDLFNEEDVHLFSSHDVGRQWRREPRPAGHYVSTIWIPENFLSEGNLLVNAAIMSHCPATLTHVHVPKAIGFQVVDSDVGNTARGDYVGPIPGVIRPLLVWTTDFCSQQDKQQVLTEELRV